MMLILARIYTPALHFPNSFFLVARTKEKQQFSDTTDSDSSDSSSATKKSRKRTKKAKKKR